MLFYADGGPGPATKLLRVHAPEDGDFATWRRAPAEGWQVKGGWRAEPQAQNMIQYLGEFTMIDPSEVIEVQHQMLLQWAEFHASP